MNGLVDLNDQDLHGNDDCLFMFAEWEGRKSLADQSAAYFSQSHGLNLGKIFKSLLQLHKCPLSAGLERMKACFVRQEGG